MTAETYMQECIDHGAWRQHPEIQRKLAEGCIDCPTHENLTRHHIVPRSMGGTDEPENIDVLCRTCHDKVHDIGGRKIRTRTSKQDRRLFRYEAQTNPIPRGALFQACLFFFYWMETGRFWGAS